MSHSYNISTGTLCFLRADLELLEFLYDKKKYREVIFKISTSRSSEFFKLGAIVLVPGTSYSSSTLAVDRGVRA